MTEPYCELKFVWPTHMPDVRYATCTNPAHTWAVVAPGTGTAKAKVEHGKHVRATSVVESPPQMLESQVSAVPDLLAALEKSVMDAKAARQAAHPAGGAA